MFKNDKKTSGKPRKLIYSWLFAHFGLLKWVFHLKVPMDVLMVVCVMGQAVFTSPTIRNTHWVRMTPISEFVALEQIHTGRKFS